ncbi:hypothetical protein GQ600_2138 [Phytophthora cactorum]|nr:hypothetical protein GQ600_2138 [Phytophthora cactorum]
MTPITLGLDDTLWIVRGWIHCVIHTNTGVKVTSTWAQHLPIYIWSSSLYVSAQWQHVILASEDDGRVPG